MFKKSLLATAIVMTSFGAQADLSVSTSTSPTVFATNIFASDVTIATATTVELKASSALSQASGTITFTLPSNVVFTDQITADNVLAPACATGTSCVSVTAGGSLGSDTVTFTFSKIDVTAADKIEINIPDVKVTSGSFSSQNMTVSSTPINANWTANGGIVASTASVDLYDASSPIAAAAVDLKSANLSVDLNKRLSFAGTNGGNAGSVNLGYGTAMDANGSTAFKPVASDTITVSIAGNFAAMSDVTYAGYKMTINEAKTNAVVELDGDDTYDGAAIFTPDGKTEIELSDYLISFDIDYSSKLVSDDTFSGQLQSSTYSGLIPVDTSAMIVTNSSSVDQTFLRITNTTSEKKPLFAQLIEQDGTVRALEELPSVPANATVVMNSQQIEDALGGTFEGRSRVYFQTSGTAGTSSDDIQVINITKGEAGVMSQIIGD